MFSYYIKEDGRIIGRTRGKYKAFDFINKLLKIKQELGIWDGLKCEVLNQNKVYLIDQTND